MKPAEKVKKNLTLYNPMQTGSPVLPENTL
jgi:hypothetical protein